MKNEPEQATKRRDPNPFEKMLPLYERAWSEALAMPEEEADADWIQNKPSGNGSNSQREPVTFVLPVSGGSIRI